MAPKHELSNPWKIRSTPGAIAALFLWQCFGVFLSHAFIYLMSRRESFFCLWGGGFFLVFLLFQALLTREARAYFAIRKDAIEKTPGTPLGFFKWLLAAVFGMLFLVLTFAYPFATYPGHWILGWIFLGLSSAVAWAESLLARAGGAPREGPQDTKVPAAAFVLFGAAIFTWVALSRDALALYSAGMVAGGFFTLGASYMLIRAD